MPAPDGPLADALPPIYRPLLPPLFSRAIPHERFSTCGNCVMCPKGNEPANFGVRRFRPDIKCCTYHPTLANYLVGGILAGDDPGLREGLARVRAKIQSRIGVNPFGLLPPPSYELRYGRGERGFGQNPSLLCPYFHREQGACTVWAFREAVCATYFCMPVAGAQGETFWTTVKEFLGHAQNAMAQHALVTLGCDLGAARDLVEENRPHGQESDDRPPSPERYDRAWGPWAGREEQLYVETHRIVQALSPAEFTRLGGVQQERLLEQLEQQRQEVLSPRVPARLRRNPALQVQESGDGTFVRGDVGVFRLQSPLDQVIALFDGERLAKEVEDLVRERHGRQLRPGLIVAMYQNRILVG